MNTFWTIVGIALLAWVGWDLYHGYTLATDVIYRDKEPLKYWLVLTVWLAIAISCFFSWGKETSDEEDWTGETFENVTPDEWIGKDE